MITGPRPSWLTFDCYGTLIQWDEGLRAAVRRVLAQKATPIEVGWLIAAYTRHEYALEQGAPHRPFREVAGTALRCAMIELGVDWQDGDDEPLTQSIGSMPPFPEVVPTLTALKQAGFRLCIISNTDDDIIAGNVAQLGGTIDRVITAEQARAYKPSRKIFGYAHQALGVTGEATVHICASPHLDLAATRQLRLRDVWIDRGTGRVPAGGYRPAATLPTLRAVMPLFEQAGWL